MPFCTLFKLEPVLVLSVCVIRASTYTGTGTRTGTGTCGSGSSITYRITSSRISIVVV